MESRTTTPAHGVEYRMPNQGRRQRRQGSQDTQDTRRSERQRDERDTGRRGASTRDRDDDDDGGVELPRPGERMSHTRRHELQQGITDRLVARHGSLAKALETLASENLDLRIDRRDLRAEVEDMAEVGEGDFLLTGDEAKAWGAFQEYLKANPTRKVADLATRVKRADELETAESQRAQAASVADAGKAVGYVNADVLQDRIQHGTPGGYVVELRDSTVIENGERKTVKVPHVRKASDDKASWELLTVVAERDWKPFLPALTAGAQGDTSTGATGGGTGNTADPGAPGATFVQQTRSGGTSGGGGSAVDKLLARKKAEAEKANPFRPAPAAK